MTGPAPRRAQDAAADGTPRPVTQLVAGTGAMPDTARERLTTALPRSRRAEHPDLAVACPYCRARPCKTPVRHREMRDTHPARRAAHAELTTTA